MCCSLKVYKWKKRDAKRRLWALSLLNSCQRGSLVNPAFHYHSAWRGGDRWRGWTSPPLLVCSQWRPSWLLATECRMIPYLISSGILYSAINQCLIYKTVWEGNEGTGTILLLTTHLTDNYSFWKWLFVLANINHMVGMCPPICICGDIHSLNSLKEQGFDDSPSAPTRSCCTSEERRQSRPKFNTSFLQLTAWSGEVYAGEAKWLQEQGHIHKITILLSWGKQFISLDGMKDVSWGTDICGLSYPLTTAYLVITKTCI